METETRKIIHIDMDAFYASVEQRDNPELRGKPVAVGGTPAGRGVVAAASYEARRYGVHSAMSASRAIKLCPKLIFCKGNFKKYREISQQLQKIYREVTDVVEPLALDEAYLDVSHNKLNEPLGRKVAMYLRARIKGQTGLTASAGVAPNKFLAKLGSELKKPNGLVVISPDRIEEVLKDLPVESLWGVGPATAKRLKRLGFKKIVELRQVTPSFLSSRLGKMGPFLWELAHGRDRRRVSNVRKAKSRGAESTFFEDIKSEERLVSELKKRADRVTESLNKADQKAHCVQIKIRYSDFTTLTRQQVLATATGDKDEIKAVAVELLKRHWDRRRGVRLLGVSVQLEKKDYVSSRQLDLPF